MRTIAFASAKGGTGKTTLSVSLAVAALEAGEQPFLVDLDPTGLASAGYPLAVIDTAGVDTAATAVALANTLRTHDGSELCPWPPPIINESARFGGIAMAFDSLMRRLFIRIAVATVSAVAAVPALAQSAAQWPERPVRLLVTVGAGGAADTLSRNLSNGFQQFANGQPLVVENRPGAGGTIAAAAVAREKPDGYTLFLAEVGPNAVSHTLAKLPYDPHTAFTPIIHAANLPAVILIRPTLPYATLSEFIAAAKQQPRKFNYASAGLGNWTHLFMAYLNSQAGIDQVNVIYRSGAEMLTSLLRNDADTAIITVSTALGQIKEGKIRALAGAAMRPMPQLPETPPAGQTIPGFDVTVWHGIVGPAGMDPALVTRINGIFNQVVQVPAVRTAITGAQAAEIVGGTPQQFDAFIKSELKRWPEVVRAAGITAQ